MRGSRLGEVRDFLTPDPAYRPTRRVCLTSNLVRCREQSVEEPVEHVGGLATMAPARPVRKAATVALHGDGVVAAANRFGHA